MAFDDKTLPAMAVSQPPAGGDYCPECGRPWTDSAAGSPRPAARFPWRAVLLSLVGLCLAITFGLRAGNSQPPAACITQSDGPPVCAPISSGTTRELKRDLLATAGGVVTVLVGIGALLRPRLRARSDRRTSVVLAVWAVGETISVVVSLQILALYAELVIVRLSQGWPLTWWEALDSITDQVSALFSIITGF
jgi:hypothetical protein